MKRSEQGGATLIVIGVIALALVIGFGTYFLIYATAEGRGRVALHNQQRSATALQASYEYFHDTCRDVLAKSQNVNVLQHNLDDLVKNTPTTDPFGQYESQVAQARTALAGTINVRNDEAQDYNAKSHEFTHNFMRSHDLPDEIGPPDGVSYDALRCENQGG